MKFRKEYEDEVRQVVRGWLLRNPLDVAWRDKFNVAFGSEEHFKTEFVHQLAWSVETKLLREVLDGKLREDPLEETDEEVTDEDVEAVMNLFRNKQALTETKADKHGGDDK